MNRRTEPSQNEDQNQQEASQPPTSSTPAGSSSGPPSYGSVRHSQQQDDASDEAQRQENMRQFNILLTPAFAAFSQISDGLFLTGVGGMSVDNFRRNKITHIINCTHEAPNWRLSGVESYRIPIDDVPTQDLTPYLDQAVERIHSILSNGGRVVVHCVAGVSRSAAIVMAYLIKHKKMTLHDAYNHVHSCRRVIRPNNGFFKQLIEYEIKELGSPSVKMVKLKRDDVTVEVPDFFESEHRKFVLLETFKAKASTMKTIVQSDQKNQPIPHSVKFQTSKPCRLSHTIPSSKTSSRSPSRSPSKAASTFKNPSKTPSKLPSKMPSQTPSNILSKTVSQALTPRSPKTPSQKQSPDQSQNSSQTPLVSQPHPPTHPSSSSQPPTQH